METDRRALFDDDHDAYRDSVRRFLAEEVAPHLDEWRAAGQVPARLFRDAGAMGLLGTAVPEHLGGGGAGDLRFGVVLAEETVAIGATGLAWTLAVHDGVCLPLLLDHGSDEQQREWVPRLAAGELIGVTAAIGAPLTMAAQDRNILVAADGDGVTLRPVPDSLAARDAGTADLHLDGAALPLASLTSLAGSLAQARRDLDLWSAVVGVAAAHTVLGLTLAYVRERRVFGRPLAEFENTRHKLASLGVALATTQLFVDTSLRKRADGTLSSPQAATARLSAAQIHDEAVDLGLQLHGGYGYMREYPISHAFADARYLRLASQTGSDARETVAAGLGL